MTRNVNPHEDQQIACENCGKLGKASNSVERKDEAGIRFALCPSCAGEYRKVMVEQDGREWVVKKMNHHVESRHRSRSAARSHAEDIAFIVDVDMSL